VNLTRCCLGLAYTKEYIELSDLGLLSVSDEEREGETEVSSDYISSSNRLTHIHRESD
jgi:hypothetical protein